MNATNYFRRKKSENIEFNTNDYSSQILNITPLKFKRSHRINHKQILFNPVFNESVLFGGTKYKFELQHNNPKRHQIFKRLNKKFLKIFKDDETILHKQNNNNKFIYENSSSASFTSNNLEGKLKKSQRNFKVDYLKERGRQPIKMIIRKPEKNIGSFHEFLRDFAISNADTFIKNKYNSYIKAMKGRNLSTGLMYAKTNMTLRNIPYF